jgi:hypothetical protein
MASNTVLETIDLQKLGFPPTSKPHHAQVEPDGSFWYVSLIGAGKVLKFDRDNHLVGSVSMEVPGLLTLHPDQDLLVAARSMSAVNPPAISHDPPVRHPGRGGYLLSGRTAGTWGGYCHGSLGVNQTPCPLEDGQLTLADVDGPAHTLHPLPSPDCHWPPPSKPGLFSIADPANPRLVKEIRWSPAH